MLPLLFLLFLFVLFVCDFDLFVSFSQVTSFVLLNSIFLSLNFITSLLVSKVFPFHFQVAFPNFLGVSDLVLLLAGYDVSFRLLQVYFLF